MENNETLDTYNRSARQLAKYYSRVGSRVKHIDLALELAGKNDGSGRALELGCGDGRDAIDIIKRTEAYTGIDYSTGLIGLAKELLPTADFRVVDMQNYDYPARSYDVIFAFDSILHLDKESVKQLFSDAARSLKIGGIFYISTKYARGYKKEWKTDKHGKRLFFYYPPKMLSDLAHEHYEVAVSDVVKINNRLWVQIALRRK
jgi:SAM-dependent methyltransferase